MVQYASTDAAQGDERNRSSIAFPYSPLQSAEQIAKTLLGALGGSASQDQIAGHLNTTPRSGSFRNKLGAARIFGAVVVSRGNVKLTDLGHRLADPEKNKSARVEAFLTVPLFDAIYREYEGRRLPPNEGLEKKIADLGVSPKQTGKARQTLKNSAKRAGFFDTTNDRLIRPAWADDGEGQPLNPAEEVPSSPRTVNGSVPLGDLWLTLLNEGEDWPASKTQEFVSAARKLRDVLASDG